MKKNVIVAFLCAAFAIGSSVLLAYGVSKVVDGNHVQKDGNVLGVSWYDEGGKEFVLSTAEELKEFARLSEYYDFAGQTVKLGADIVLNEGTAADFKDHAPANLWKPIVGFAGTFDGQGHTISGMYARSADSEMAMFIRPDYHCTVKDFSLKNSYFNTEGHSGVACVMANGGGAYSGIYSDAVMEHRGENVGGIGSMVSAKASFDECWFDGSISTTMRGVGGLIDCVGLTTVEVRHCLFSGDMTMSYVPLHAIDLGGRTGGLVGYVMNGGTLTTEDCLVSGTLQTGNINHTGTLLGVLGGNGQATVTDTYVASDIFRYVLGAIGGSMKGLPVSIQRSNLIGAKGYEWTNLNFGKYWTVTAGQTPVLKRFSSGGLDVTGLEKAFDTSWYSPNKSEFELHTAKELYGLYYLSAQDSFENKTVTLGEDISLNSGNAAEWDENPPDQVWQPVGINIFPFKGTFDGKMHTVSGVYIHSEGQFNGLFGATKDATVKNLKLKNSYIASTDQWVGSIVGRGNGTFTNIYSDATVVSSAAFEGGMVGQADYGPITMSGCWFDGKVINTYAEGENSRGFVGGLIGYVAGVDTVIEDSLFTGHLDISALNVKQRAGASGFIGVCVGTPQMRNILMMGTVNGSRMDGYYAHTGEGTPEGGTAYAVLTAPEEHYTDWQGNYGGRPSEQFDYKAISREAATGSIARFTMPELDWAGTWLAVSGAHPVLRVFADEATPSAEPFDVDWYSSEPYVLQDADDLYGFAKLVSNGVDFEGKTVTLGADITFNEGSAADWAAKAPENVWSPIGNKEAPFKGTFDGSMHTISGLYVNSQERYTGLFGCVDGATVKSLKLKNSYISSTEQWTGSIAGRGSGTFTELYSDAIVVCANAFEGGFIGQVDSGPVTMTDCWFNGTVTNVYAAGENSRGFVGGFTGYVAGVDVNVKGCLFTGHIDLSAMKVKESAGAGGLLGVCDNGIITLRNVQMLGSVKGGEKIGYYANTGQGISPEGSAAYAVLTAPNGDYSDWQGNYGGYPTDKFTHRAVTRDAVTGSIARLALPELDWTDTWQTVSGVHPVLQVFADEV
ncbi:MAG: hypothetical protein IJU18_02035, partial [Oscillospiraceae bacterium]|nr:hypothetical protein [Oscillospiraceae bacterium]